MYDIRFFEERALYIPRRFALKLRHLKDGSNAIFYVSGKHFQYTSDFDNFYWETPTGGFLYPRCSYLTDALNESVYVSNPSELSMPLYVNKEYIPIGFESFWQQLVNESMRLDEEYELNYLRQSVPVNSLPSDFIKKCLPIPLALLDKINEDFNQRYNFRSFYVGWAGTYNKDDSNKIITIFDESMGMYITHFKKETEVFLQTLGYVEKEINLPLWDCLSSVPDDNSGFCYRWENFWDLDRNSIVRKPLHEVRTCETPMWSARCKYWNK